MNTDALLAEIYETLHTHFPNNRALVPIAHSLEQRPGENERWYAYLEIRSGADEYDITGDANNLPMALRRALTSLRKIVGVEGR